MKHGKNSRKRIQELERRQRRLLELEEETRECYESVLERYQLPIKDQEDLEREWKLGLNVIVEYEDATPEDFLYLDIGAYNSEPLSDLVGDWGVSEASWRACFDLANALGLALITIDEAGNINGEIVMY
ncbi:hypothetical protein C6503_17255 [Candidatus Poribacteria bacterium]|nr:MAG: hypothetical protein C6503_17255 [Candidatus Poribacteria bacterium]